VTASNKSADKASSRSAGVSDSPVSFSNPPGLYDPSANGYSHLALVRRAARLVFVSGQGGESATGTLEANFRLQVRQAFRNLAIALEAAGAKPGQVAKLTLLVVDHTEEKLRLLGRELDAAFGAGPKPACTLVPVPRLALDGMLFEVEAIAALPA